MPESLIFAPTFSCGPVYGILALCLLRWNYSRSFFLWCRNAPDFIFEFNDETFIGWSNFKFYYLAGGAVVALFFLLTDYCNSVLYSEKCTVLYIHNRWCYFNILEWFKRKFCYGHNILIYYMTLYTNLCTLMGMNKTSMKWNEGSWDYLSRNSSGTDSCHCLKW